MDQFHETFSKLKVASKSLSRIHPELINQALEKLAVNTLTSVEVILEANQKDLAKMDKSDPKYDRLLLNEDRIQAIVSEIRQIKSLPTPLGKSIENRTLDNGLELNKISVPLGVLGVIYEARPNVTFDVFCIALKSGNGLVLKGSSDAADSNQAIIKVIHDTLSQLSLPTEAFILLPPERSATQALLEAVGFVDIIIPRGSQSLINYVRDHAKVPVIETGAGIVHCFFDESADLEMGKSIIFNAKTRRPSVCNSLDCLIIHENRLHDLLALITDLLDAEVEIFADRAALSVLPEHDQIKAANESHFGTEFLALKMAIKTVQNIDEALTHIDQFSSKHSESIVTNSAENKEIFLQVVDAAAVYVNASTAFTDGNQFGMGAEIGISTQKLHARGPMALPELTSYKWVIRGNGQIR
ncbi:glutamate-5-semialdehyde dehydrogenase [Belliella kenyensis]|uniref:Gamma-glutamyl phosphate reductase n=1 Tax=Belliella kenyensis TaxID=1472724 RepID=A0ABV8ER73_9BACT|nr:glutamate-5-semialdehyde dehydrogenase [Belliella kenyensis]MCH7401975.1 glutamate-5-semialdehyde dehydrogenase [Belliella kenyensis]MDN3605139.1 glutamate-5-semialdehyde dehydrogenase [Belliella kenyensis]